MKYFSFSIVIIAGISCVILAGVFTVAAQAPRTLANVGRRLDNFERQSEKLARDEMDREMRGRRPTAEERRLAELRKAQIKEDFETLQSTYNEILTKLQAKETLSDRYVLEAADRINKSGSRLRDNIGFPATKTGEIETAAAEASSVKVLCIQLHAFLTSPMFETGVLDIIEAERTRNTLNRVIRIAESIRHNLGKIN